MIIKCKYSQKQIILFILFVFNIYYTGLGQVGVGTTTPDQSSVLEIFANNKGLLIPKVELENISDNSLDGVHTAATGLLIFNTNRLTVGGTGEGFYYFNGTIWERLITNDSAPTDADWWVENTTNTPTNINQNIYTQGSVAIGKNIPNYKLDIAEFTGTRALNANISTSDPRPLYAAYFSNLSSGSGPQYGVYSQVTNQQNGFHFGAYNNLSGGGSGNHYGIFNNLQGTGTGALNGIENYFTASTTNSHKGLINQFLQGNAPETGVQNNFSANGSGEKVGIENNFTTNSSSFQTGIKSNFTNSSISSLQYGTSNTFGGTSTGLRVGLINYFQGSGLGSRYAIQNDFTGSYGGIAIGLNNNFNTTGSLVTQIGINNSFSNAGGGTIIGLQNNITNTNNAVHFGVYNILQGANANTLNATANLISGSSNAQASGTTNEIINSGNGRHFGTRNIVYGTGSGKKFGTFNLLDPTAGGIHYGVYSSVLKPGSFAGFFAGQVAIGTSDENSAPNYYIMPPTRGTNNQIMQTDGNGQVSWADLPPQDTFAALKIGTINTISGFINNVEIPLIFEQVDHNLGGGNYNSGNGQYTVPYNGVYNIAANFNVSFSGAATTELVLALRIYKNGVILQQIIQGSEAPLGGTFSLQTYTFQNDYQLNANDVLSFRIAPVTNGATPSPSILGANTHILVKKVF